MGVHQNNSHRYVQEVLSIMRNALELSSSDKALINLLQSSKLVPQSPTDVCVKCYDSASPFYNTRWLTWLECAKHPDHRDEMGVTLIVGDDCEVVEVLELPKNLAECSPQQLVLCEKMRQRRGCPDEVNCKKAHSKEELEYWKWTLIHKVLEKVQYYILDVIC